MGRKKTLFTPHKHTSDKPFTHPRQCQTRRNALILDAGPTSGYCVILEARLSEVSHGEILHLFVLWQCEAMGGLMVPAAPLESEEVTWAHRSTFSLCFWVGHVRLKGVTKIFASFARSFGFLARCWINSFGCWSACRSWNRASSHDRYRQVRSQRPRSVNF